MKLFSGIRQSAGQKARQPWWWAWLLAVVLGMPIAWAEGIQILESRVEWSGEGQDAGWQLNAQFRMDLGQRLEDAVNRGLPLIFLAEVEVQRPRWYWFNEKIATNTQTYRLSYNALTQQYRVSTGTLTQRFDTLAEAISMMSRISRLRLAGRNELKPGETYEVAARLRLDVSQLPKPFQINAITNREWTLTSDWKRFVFVATAEPAS